MWSPQFCIDQKKVLSFTSGTNQCSTMAKKSYAKSTKRKSKAPWPAPKRGKMRAVLKKPSKKNTFTSVPYVRHGNVSEKFRAHNQRWGRSIHSFMTMSYLDLVKTLQKDKILPDWQGCTCPRCGEGTIGKLKFVKSRESWMYQCSGKRCKKYLQVDDFHPIFFRGNGNSVTPLKAQAAILYAAVAGVPINSAHLIMDVDHKPVERIYNNLDVARARYVEQEEKSITYGRPNDSTWVDVEADEVDLGKGLEDATDGQGKVVRWEQWCGLVERGRPASLRLFRLNPPVTKPRAPGPGPIRKYDWRAIGTPLLSDRHVVLHTDGARAYKLKLPGVCHCNVVHKKKRTIVNKKAGFKSSYKTLAILFFITKLYYLALHTCLCVFYDKQVVWVKPHYTKVYNLKLPNKKTLKVKSGTQIIDRFWGHVRTHIKHTSRAPGNLILRRKIRAAQFTYWFRTKNAWTSAGVMLEALFNY